MNSRLTAVRGPVGVLAAISFVSQLGIAIMLPLIPLYALSLGATPIVLGLLTASFSVASAIGQLVTGYLIDRLGPRRFIRAGIGGYALMNGLIASVTSAAALIAFRSLAGLSAGANLVSTRVYVAGVTDPKRLAFTNGILSAAASAGSVIGPAIGGLVAAASNLSVPFAIVASTSAIAFFASLRLPPVPPRHVAPGPAAQARSYGRPVLILLAANFFLLMGFGGFITTYAPFATTRLGWSITEVGLIFSIFGLGDITLGPWLGHLADRTGRRRMAMLASLPIALFGIGIVIGLPRPVLYAITFVTGGGLTAFNGSWFALLTSVVPAERRGRVFGTVSAVSNAGTVIGAIGASIIWQALDLSGGLILASAACLAAGGMFFFLPSDLARPAGVVPAPA